MVHEHDDINFTSFHVHGGLRVNMFAEARYRGDVGADKAHANRFWTWRTMLLYDCCLNHRRSAVA